MIERGRLAEACERFGIAYKTAAQAAWVAGAFESSSRLEDLSFGHYDAVCGNPQAGELLEWAAESGATVVRPHSMRRKFANPEEN